MTPRTPSSRPARRGCFSSCSNRSELINSLTPWNGPSSPIRSRRSAGLDGPCSILGAGYPFEPGHPRGTPTKDRRMVLGLMFLFAASVGHVALLVYGLNRVYSIPLPHRL